MSQQSNKNQPTRLLKTQLPSIGRSWFNRSYVSNWSGLPGRAIPCGCKHIPANSLVKLDIVSQFESLPAVTPIKSNFIMDYEVFFCPTRLYVPQLRSNNVRSVGYYANDDGVDNVPFPRLKVTTLNSPTWTGHNIAIGSVLNRLGLPAYSSYLRSNYLLREFVDWDIEKDGQMAIGQHSVSEKNLIPYLAYLDVWCRNYANVNEPNVPVEQFSISSAALSSNSTNNPLVITQEHIKLSTLQEIVSNFGFGKTQLNATGIVSDASVPYMMLDCYLPTLSGNVWNPLSVVNTSYPGSEATSAIYHTYAVKYLQNIVIPKGLLPVTYMPDYFSTWISSDSYDKANVSIDSNNLSVSTIRIAQRKFMSLAKQLFSRHTYTDWNYTQFGASLKLCDYPIFVGKDRVVFNFDTLRSMAQTGNGANQYIGAGAGLGRGTNSAKPIKFQTEEDGYLLVIASLVPEVNYHLGHDKFFDYLGMQDLPLPAYDAVGFQDLQRGEFATSWNLQKDTESVGKVPYGYELMTSVNRSHGLMQTEAFRSWVFNREEVDPTTYVDPSRFNYNFVNIGQNEDNFVIDTLFNLKVKQPFSKQLLHLSK